MLRQQKEVSPLRKKQTDYFSIFTRQDEVTVVTSNGSVRTSPLYRRHPELAKKMVRSG